MAALHQRWSAIDARLAQLEAGLGSEALKCRQTAVLSRLDGLAAILGLNPAEVFRSAPLSASTSSSASASSAAHKQQGQQQHHHHHHQAHAPQVVPTPGASPVQQRLELELAGRGISHFSFVRVPGDYYDRPLEARQALLSAASVDHLCKSIIMENTRAHPSAIDEADPLSPKNWANPRNSRYYVIIVQYTARLHAEKLKTFIHRLNEGVGKQYFNMRLAPEAVSDALSGYEHNAVTPFGMKVPDLPVIISHRITHLTPDFFFLGGGEVDLKLGLPASEYVARYQPLVADITY